MITPHKTTPKTDNQRNSNDIEIEIAAKMNLPSTKRDIENEPKAQEQQTNKEKTQPQISKTQKMKLEEAEMK